MKQLLLLYPALIFAFCVLAFEAKAQVENSTTNNELIPPSKLQFSCPSAQLKPLEFWSGNWEVYSRGKFTGANEVRFDGDKCLITEKWAGINGTRSQRFLRYDSGKELWKQIWIDESGNTFRFIGNFKNGSMVLYGQAANYQLPSQQVYYRMTYNFDENQNKVEQVLESSVDLISWENLYQSTYVKEESQELFLF